MQCTTWTTVSAIQARAQLASQTPLPGIQVWNGRLQCREMVRTGSAQWKHSKEPVLLPRFLDGPGPQPSQGLMAQINFGIVELSRYLCNRFLFVPLSRVGFGRLLTATKLGLLSRWQKSAYEIIPSV